MAKKMTPLVVILAAAAIALATEDGAVSRFKVW